MLISHKESSKTQTNSILSSYYRDTDLDAKEITNLNSKLVNYQDRVNSSIGQINTAMMNYFNAARYMFMLEKRLADILEINLDWSKTEIASTYEGVIDYDLNQ